MDLTPKSPTDCSERSPRSLGLSELQVLFTDMRGELVRFLKKRTGDRDLAADLIHDVFIKLWCVHAVIPDAKHGRAYLYRMAVNLANDHARTQRRRTEILTGSDVLFEDEEDNPEATVVARDQLRIVEAALCELPSLCRDILLLSKVEGMKHTEIATKLGVSVSLVEKYKSRALRHCRTRLDRWE